MFEVIVSLEDQPMFLLLCVADHKLGLEAVGTPYLTDYKMLDNVKIPGTSKKSIPDWKVKRKDQESTISTPCCR